MRWLLLVVLAGLLPCAHAHMMKVDGDAGVVMHVDPDDDPVAGEPARFFFEIKHRSAEFSASACDCRVQVTHGTRTVFEQAVQPASFHASVASFVFPEGGVYRVSLSGKPRNGAARFAPFAVGFDVRVENAQASGSARRYWPAAGIAVLLAAVGLAVAFARKRKK